MKTTTVRSERFASNRLQPSRGHGSRLAAMAVAAAITGASAVASAQAVTPGVGADVTAEKANTSLHTSDYVAAGSLLAGVGLSLAFVPQRHDGWTSGGVLMDDGIRDAIALPTREGRDRAVSISDATYYGSIVSPVLIHPTIAAARGRTEAAWQMTVINAESFALTGMVSVLTQRLVARTRPFAQECAKDSKYDVECGDSSVKSQSFLSGHTAMAFTGAGLTCAHTRRLALYGQPFDTLACVAGLAVATTTGVTRMMADKHYATDVLAGAAVGIASGFVWPTLAHGRAAPEGATSKKSTGRVMVAPTFGGSSVGLSAIGVL